MSDLENSKKRSNIPIKCLHCIFLDPPIRKVITHGHYKSNCVNCYKLICSLYVYCFDCSVKLLRCGVCNNKICNGNYYIGILDYIIQKYNIKINRIYKTEEDRNAFKQLVNYNDIFNYLRTNLKDADPLTCANIFYNL